MRLIPLALTLSLVTSAAAQTVVYSVPLSGDQSSPPVVTAGSGFAGVTLDVMTGLVTVEGSYANMSSDVLDTHLHGMTPRGQNIGVIIGLTPTGGTTGSFGGSGMLSPTQVQDMLDGLTYLNVHTVNHTGGEIRGQVDSVENSGHPGAQFVDVSGAASPGGTLNIQCPPSTGQDFIVLGVALPPGQTDAYSIPELCPPVPVNVAINLAVPALAFAGSSVALQFPTPFPELELAIQCVTLTPGNCLEVSGARRIAVRN